MDRRSLLKGLVFATAVATADLKKLNGTPVVAKADGALVPCDGRALSRKAYPELFQLIGTNYGAGDEDETTFNLPNFGDRIDPAPKGEDVGELTYSIPVIAIRDMPPVPLGSILFVSMKEKDLASIA